MKPERMQRIEQLYQAASLLEPGRRGAYLEAACAGDDLLRKEVESLLGYREAAQEFLEIPAVEKAAGAAPDEAAIPAGDRIGRFQILERLGAGGMGVVYRAWDPQLNRPLAVKILPAAAAADQERRARFVREAKAASALNHPNIITIYDIGRDEGVDFIAMEYVEGRTLRDLMDSERLPEADALEYSVQIAEALAAAHAAGIVHRDIKPGNIMITGGPTGQRQVKVLDFGLAKLSEPSRPEESLEAAATAEGMILGTAAYMSPEQAEGRAADPRSDIFSFGAVLYEMLSGRRPFQRQSCVATLAAVLHEDPPPLHESSAGQQSVVARCLRKDPAHRFQRADELKRALEAAASSRAVARRLKSIAVLPFDNLSTDKENEYFSDGLAEDIIDALTRIPGLQVTARTSAFAFRGRQLDVREIGARLNVEHILEGSVRRAGNRVRVTAQLIDVASGYHLWSDRFDREMTDVFTIQDDVAQAIVDTLRIRLSGDQPTRRSSSATESYTLYLRGRYYQAKRTLESNTRARDCFEKVIAEDTEYAPALLGIAEVHWQSALYGWGSPGDALAEAEKAVRRALEIDDTLAEGHAIAGSLAAIMDFDWKSSRRSFERAIQIDPNSPFILFRYANYCLWPTGRIEEAMATLERALAYDPLAVFTLWVLGYCAYSIRDYDRALKHLMTVTELEPAFYGAWCAMGLVYLRINMPEEATRALEEGCRVCNDNPFTVGMLAYGLGRTGRTEEAGKLLSQLEEWRKQTFVPAKSFMFAFAGLNDWDEALEWAARSVEERDPMTVMNLPAEPLFDEVRTDPRFQAILRKMNLVSAL